MAELKNAVELCKTYGKFICIYGEGGIGKTHFVFNTVNPKPIHMISLQNDGGMSTLKNLDPKIHQFITGEIFETPQNPIMSLINRLKELYEDKTINVTTLVLDPFTNLRDNQFIFYKKTVFKEEKQTLAMWGQIKTDFTELFKMMAILKNRFNVILICHEESFELKSNVFTLGPNVGGSKVFPHLMQNCDEVIRISKDPVSKQRTFDFGSNPEYIKAKTRSYGNLEASQLLMTGLTIDHLI